MINLCQSRGYRSEGVHNSWKGKFFEIYFITLADKCETENVDCGIHGKCVNDESDDGYTCYCQPGYTGDKCEKGNFAWKYYKI